MRSLFRLQRSSGKGLKVQNPVRNYVFILGISSVRANRPNLTDNLDWNLFFSLFRFFTLSPLIETCCIFCPLHGSMVSVGPFDRSSFIYFTCLKSSLQQLSVTIHFYLINFSRVKKLVSFLKIFENFFFRNLASLQCREWWLNERDQLWFVSATIRPTKVERFTKGQKNHLISNAHRDKTKVNPPTG